MDKKKSQQDLELSARREFFNRTAVLGVTALSSTTALLAAQDDPAIMAEVPWGQKWGDGIAFAKLFKTNFYPSSVFFDKNGKMIFLEIGYHDNNAMPNEIRFLNILKFVSSSSYKKVDFDEYMFKKGIVDDKFYGKNIDRSILITSISSYELAKEHK